MEHFVWNVNPIIFDLGPLQLRWYGLLFVGSFFLGSMLLTWMYKRENKDPAVVEHLLVYLMVGAVIGSRLVHCFFYEPSFYLSHPLEILYIWKGGLASHGGLLGAFIAMYLFAKKYNESYLWVISRVAIPGALTAACVRFGNLFNSEILGKPSELPWAIVFERIDLIPRHPVQLYEAFSYLTIMLLLVVIYRKVSFAFSTRLLPGVFLVLLFSARFFIEYTKTRQAAYTTDIGLSTGQLLSIPYVLIGIVMITMAIYKNQNNKNTKD